MELEGEGGARGLIRTELELRSEPEELPRFAYGHRLLTLRVLGEQSVPPGGA